MHRRLGPPQDGEIGSPTLLLMNSNNEIPIAAGRRPVSAGARRALESLLIGVERRGAVLPHHVVAEIDEGEPDELGDVQYLDIAEPGEGSADAGKQGTNGNKNVSKKPGPPRLNREILDGRVHGSAE